MQLTKSQKTRALFYLAGDAINIGFATLLSITLMGSLWGMDTHTAAILLVTPISFVIGLALTKMYRVSWRYTSIRELLKIAAGLLIGALLSVIILNLYYPPEPLLALSPALSFAFSILTVGGFRISKRLYNEVLKRPQGSRPTVIFGAGNAGEQILRDINRNPEWNIDVQALFDDDKNIKGMRLHGIGVAGGRDALYEYLKYKLVDQLIIAAPSMPKAEIRNIVDEAKTLSPDVKIKILPSFHKLSESPVSFSQIRDIRLEDVLGREVIELNLNEIHKQNERKSILITGAGGSIGSEIVRQITRFNPKQIIAVDIDETELHKLDLELQDFGELITTVADVTDSEKMSMLFERYQPNIVYHAAAYKHVPMMERFPEEAIRVNVMGTKTVVECARHYGIEKFVMISTDKAVNPTNVMGATKRVAEQICMHHNDLGPTQFISVRFGNVLGSRGSVIPTFLDQIKNGGPVTVTHKDIKRYFMTIPEAVLLVMQSATLGCGGEVFVLDMGEPVKILDMAKELIRLQGLEPDVDISIKFTGLRPGEKMYEELLTAEEGVRKTTNEQIFIAKNGKVASFDETLSIINDMEIAARRSDHQLIRNLLGSLVPNFNQKQTLEATLKSVS